MTLYADVSDLRLVLDSTDAGTGTAAQLSDEQLTLALTAASDRVELYTGYSWDTTADAPSIVHDLTLDLGAWWATTYYSKQKEMGPNHPVVLRYTEAVKVLEEIRSGKITLSAVEVQPGTDITAGEPAGLVINRIPAIFTGEDSNTEIIGDQLVVSTPPDMWRRPRTLLGSWQEGA